MEVGIKTQGKSSDFHPAFWFITCFSFLYFFRKPKFSKKKGHIKNYLRFLCFTRTLQEVRVKREVKKMTNEEFRKEIGRIADGLKNAAIANQEAIRSIIASLNEYIQGLERLTTRCEKCGGLGAKWRGDMNLCEECFDAIWEEHYAKEYRAEDLALEEAREEILKEN